MFIQTEKTPNPNTLKFNPGCEISPHSPTEFLSIEDAQTSILARDLFAVDGVVSVFAGADFVSVTKDASVEWMHIKPAVLGAITDALESGQPILSALKETDNIVYEGETAKIVTEIKDVIDSRVRPAVARDGGDIVFHSYDDSSGIVYLHMRGACAGCPSASWTLKQGIENLLKHYVPEVYGVEAIV